MSLERTVAEAFDLGGAILEIRPLGHGLINDTFLVTTSGQRAVLQRINRRAFPQPELIMQNLRRLRDHLATRQNNLLALPGVIPARDGRDFVIDADGGFWRTLDFFENTKSFETIRDADLAGEIGAGLGRFHAQVHELAPERLHMTRPGFHQTPTYYARLLEVTALKREHTDSAELTWCLAFATARHDIVSVLEDARQSGALRPSVIHGDPKLDNFLFDADTGRVVGMIDLDTVQPGLLHYDVGDCLRSCANPAGESPPDATQARFDLDICHAILTRYLAEMRGLLSAQDTARFYDAIRLIPFELGLRFLTDHLEGDVYFRTDWRGQNLRRALVQFRLTGSIEEHERSIKKLIADLSEAS